MKVYKINDYDWIIAKTKSEAVIFYIDYCRNECGLSDEEIDIEDVREEKKLKTMIFVDDSRRQMTFKQRLEEYKGKVPALFATTEIKKRYFVDKRNK